MIDNYDSLTLNLVRELVGLGVTVAGCLPGSPSNRRRFLTRAKALMHGKTSDIQHNGQGVFKALQAQ